MARGSPKLIVCTSSLSLFLPATRRLRCHPPLWMASCSHHTLFAPRICASDSLLYLSHYLQPESPSKTASATLPLDMPPLPAPKSPGSQTMLDFLTSQLGHVAFLMNKDFTPRSPNLDTVDHTLPHVTSLTAAVPSPGMAFLPPTLLSPCSLYSQFKVSISPCPIFLQSPQAIFNPSLSARGFL